MGTVEADRNKFASVSDLMYLNLSDKHATPGPLFSSAKAIGKSLILSPEAGYRIVGDELDLSRNRVVGRDFGEQYALVFGYRHLHVAYDKDRFLFDTGMGGPVLGFAFKF